MHSSRGSGNDAAAVRGGVAVHDGSSRRAKGRDVQARSVRIVPDLPGKMCHVACLISAVSLGILDVCVFWQAHFLTGMLLVACIQAVYSFS